ncbi:10800_t:CDS:2, partial [Gigaspora margarita]
GMVMKNYIPAWFYDMSEGNRYSLPSLNTLKFQKESGQVGIKAFAKEPVAHVVVKSTAKGVLKHYRLVQKAYIDKSLTLRIFGYIQVHVGLRWKDKK